VAKEKGHGSADELKGTSAPATTEGKPARGRTKSVVKRDDGHALLDGGKKGQDPLSTVDRVDTDGFFL